MKLLTLLSLLMFFTACKPDSSGSDIVSGGSLLGTWEVCEDDANAPASSSKLRAVFTSTAMTFTYFVYADVGCDLTKLETTEVTEYNYSLVGPNIETVVQGANWTLHKTSGALSYDVNAANTVVLCGFNDWALNTTKNIINLTCDGITTTLGDVESAAYSLNGSQLVMGTVTYQKQ